MQAEAKTLIDLEKKFWQSMVDHDAETATQMLCEPALMVSSHGAMKFDRAEYRRMAAQDALVLSSFQLSDMNVLFANDDTAILTYHVRQSMTEKGKAGETVQEMNDTSTWIRSSGEWQCVMHTETPAQPARH